MTVHEAAYDRYFGLLKSPGRLRTAPVVAAVIGDLPRTGLTEDERTVLAEGMHLASRVVAAAHPRAPFDAEPVDGLPGPLRRWKLGHQVFHLLLTAMNSGLDDALAAARTAAWPSLLHDMEQLRLLYDAATAAMEYAADFPAVAYRDGVRPTMTPPHVPPGFSGAFNRDHRVMVRRLRGLERAMRTLPPDVPALAAVHRGAAALQGAQCRNRRHHARICRRCVPGGASLLRLHFAREDPACDTG
ncbi:hypothetical protein I5Q34_08280 [Streptomyces sp. AV19]|uniref:hypothetical protein n=1 Tax=Streptomyces sp. AV19 TaxID=2793068 RepID=UPI0018FEEB94|nr:hypothetical protein [Streptomyces sp. AV19]MBH1934291.1 hypothetical protein [Streptomyces sp. AV19]MDG4533400.1 hypothetical protein [Streptomyces sp. AV19]